MKKTIPHTIAQWMLDRTADGKAAKERELVLAKAREEKDAQERMAKRLQDGEIKRLQNLLENDIKNNAPAKDNVQTAQFLQDIEQAGFKPTGVLITPNFEIHNFDTTDNGVQVWVHKAGDLFRVYKHVNDNNLASVLNTLVNPDSRINKAKGALDRAVKRINNKEAYAQGAHDLTIVELSASDEIALYEDCILGAAKQLLLAE